MMTKKLFFSLIALLVAFAGIAQQTREEIQKKQQDLQQELAELNKNYDEIKKNKKQSLAQLALVQRRIRAREELVSTLNKDLRRIDDDIYLTTLEMNRMRRELDTLKLNYAQSLVFAYKNRSNYDYLNFIFSASSFNDAVKRVAYLRSYRQFRATQVDNIVKTQQVMTEKANFLTSSKTDKNKALKDHGQQLVVLEDDKKEKDKVVQDLKGQESEISSQIKAHQQAREKLNKALQIAIRREREERMRLEKERLAREKEARDKAAAEEERKRKIAAAAEKAAADKAAADKAAQNKPVTPANPPTSAPDKTATVQQPPKATPKPVETSTGGMVVTSGGVTNRDYNVFESTPEGLTMSLNFEGNRGKLPWPVDKGFVSIHFGPYTIPGTNLKGISDGITISLPKGTSVKSVADGEVSTVADMGGMQAVIIIHGKYFTTYSNLSTTNVNRGDKVKAGTLLGKAAEGDDGEGQVTFMVSNDKTNLNPELWLKRR